VRVDRSFDHLTEEPMTPAKPEPGTDTPTGTDPDATWDGPGYEDKSLGQAVQQDEELAEELAASDLSEEEASERFDEVSHGAPARQRQTGGNGGER
jgi:hypothetical protein